MMMIYKDYQSGHFHYFGHSSVKRTVLTLLKIKVRSH